MSKVTLIYYISENSYHVCAVIAERKKKEVGQAQEGKKDCWKKGGESLQTDYSILKRPRPDHSGELTKTPFEGKAVRCQQIEGD